MFKKISALIKDRKNLIFGKENEVRAKNRVIKKKIFDWKMECFKIVDLDHKCNIFEDDSNILVEISGSGKVIELPYGECTEILKSRKSI